MKKRLGFVGVIIENRQNVAPKVNALISEYGEQVVARMGLPYKERHCSVITLIVDMNSDEVGSLTGKLGAIEGVMVKAALAKK